EHLARDFQSARIHTAGHCATTAAMNAIVGACYAGNGIKQYKNVFARLDHPAATLDHKTGEPDVGFQVLIVGGGDHFSLYRTLEVGDFLGPFVNQEDQHMHFRVVGCDG